MLLGRGSMPGFQNDFTIPKSILVLSRPMLIFGPSPSHEMMPLLWATFFAQNRIDHGWTGWRVLRRRPSASAAIRALRTFSAVIGTVYVNGFVLCFVAHLLPHQLHQFDSDEDGGAQPDTQQELAHGEGTVLKICCRKGT
jgi:hypothetical protein